MNQTEMRVVVVDKVEKALSVVKNADKTPSLELVVVINGVSDDLRKAADDQSVAVMSFAEMEVS